MKILALDSATPHGGVALLDGERVCGHALVQGEADHVARLPEAVVRLLEEAGWQPGDLDGVAVTLGPGSFTGVRIALGLAKGLALGLGIPVAGVSTLELVAVASGHTSGVVVPILDARRGEVFAGGYRLADLSHPLLVPRAWSPADLVQALRELDAPPPLLTGPGVPLILPLLAEACPVADPALWPLDPVHLARLGAQRLAEGDLLPAELLEPLYLRRSEAEEKRLAAGA